MAAAMQMRNPQQQQQQSMPMAGEAGGAPQAMPVASVPVGPSPPHAAMMGPGQMHPAQQQQQQQQQMAQQQRYAAAAAAAAQAQQQQQQQGPPLTHADFQSPTPRGHLSAVPYITAQTIPPTTAPMGGPSPQFGAAVQAHQQPIHYIVSPQEQQLAMWGGGNPSCQMTPDGTTQQQNMPEYHQQMAVAQQQQEPPQFCSALGAGAPYNFYGQSPATTGGAPPTPFLSPPPSQQLVGTPVGGGGNNIPTDETGGHLIPACTGEGPTPSYGSGTMNSDASNGHLQQANFWPQPIIIRLEQQDYPDCSQQTGKRFHCPSAQPLQQQQNGHLQTYGMPMGVVDAQNGGNMIRSGKFSMYPVFVSMPNDVVRPTRMSPNQSTSALMQEISPSNDRYKQQIQGQIATKNILFEEVNRKIFEDKLRNKQGPAIQSELQQKRDALCIELIKLDIQMTAASLPCSSSSITEASTNNSIFGMETSTSGSSSSQHSGAAVQRSQISEPISLVALRHQLEQIKHELVEWQDQSRLFTIGPTEAQEWHFQKLIQETDSLEDRLSHIGEKLLEHHAKNVTNASALFIEFLCCLPIIRVQPPYYRVCPYDHIAEKNSKYWFDVSIQLLCSKFLHKNDFSFRATCELVDEGIEENQFFLADDAMRTKIIKGKKKKEEKKNDANQQPLPPSPVAMQIHGYKAAVEKLAIVAHDNSKRTDHSEHVYKILFLVEIHSAQFSIGGKLFSHEIAIHRNKTEEALTVKRFFKNQPTVQSEQMMIVIEMLFQGKLKSFASQIPGLAYEYVPLSERARKSLLHRVTNNTNKAEAVPLDDLFTRTFNEEEPFTFLEWLYGAAKILCVNDTVYEMWKKRLIYGFCSREDASLHVQCCADAVLVRFANFDYSRETETAAFSVDALTNNGTVLPSPITWKSFEKSKESGQHFALVCGGIRLNAENKGAPLSAGYSGRKCRIYRWIVVCFQKLNFEQTHTVEQRGTVDFGTECLNVARRGDANAPNNWMKRALSPKASKGEKKAKPAVKLHHPLGPDDINTHANGRNCRVIFNYQSGMKISEGDAMIVNFKEHNFIIEASHDEFEGVRKVKYHHSE